MRVRIAALVLALVASVATPLTAQGTERPASAGRFIVTLRDSSDSRSVAAEYRRDGADIDFVYRYALNGFAGAFTDSTLGQLRADGRVVRIEADGIARKSATTQPNATWGLDRIDHRTTAPTLDGGYTYDHTGFGVKAYIIDTGIKRSHADFGGRAVPGYDAITAGGTADDCNGHGTHVAGTVGGTTWGVAKAVSLVAVRVLDCNGSGTWSGVIAGLDWVAGDHAAGAPAVANMSLGGGASTSVDNAVKNVITDGVTMAVAAGNGNQAGVEQDACGYSPARVLDALTIGATDKTDTKTSWSNYGACVDLFAPGSSITSAWYTSTSATNTISGTSMATPHVAGVAALYLQQVPSASPAAVSGAIKSGATQGIVKSSSTAANHLLYSLVTKAPEDVVGSDPNTAPVAEITAQSCSGAACTFSGTGTDPGDVVTLAWTFGNGTSAGNDGTTNVTYTSTGTFTVTLTATDSKSSTGTDSTSVRCGWSKGKNKTLICQLA